MARWRLQAAHYIYTNPPMEWEYKETDRNTGRQNRMVAKVPRYIDPKDPADQTEGGEVYVCDGNNPNPRDIIFVGPPTPDMEPIDAEAKKISQSFIDRGDWTKPEEGVEYGEGLIKRFMEQIADLRGPPAPVSTAGIDPSAFAKIQEQVQALMEQNAKLQAQILEKPARRAV